MSKNVSSFIKGGTRNRFISDTEGALMGGKRLLFRTEIKKIGHLQLMLPEETAFFKLCK